MCRRADLKILKFEDLNPDSFGSVVQMQSPNNLYIYQQHLENGPYYIG
ncbi:hypothetical protein BH11BAC1_BH11BAC1_26750 [soil metagenome]